MFFALLGGGLLFLALLLYFTGDIEFQRAVGKVSCGREQEHWGSEAKGRTREHAGHAGDAGDAGHQPASSRG